MFIKGIDDNGIMNTFMIHIFIWLHDSLRLENTNGKYHRTNTRIL